MASADAFPASRKPSSASHEHGTVAATLELGDVVDDVHEPCLGHVVSLRSLG